MQKNNINNLEDKRFIFFLIACITVLGVAYAGINLKSFQNNANNIDLQVAINDEYWVELKPVNPIKQNYKLPAAPKKAKSEVWEITDLKKTSELEKKELVDFKESDLFENFDSHEALVEERKEFNQNIYDYTPEMPCFPECAKEEDQLLRDFCTRERIKGWIQENFQLPSYFTSGTIVAQFIVDEDGIVQNVELINKLDKRLNQEAIRCIQSLPQFKAGKQNNKVVKVRYSIPIHIE